MKKEKICLTFVVAIALAVTLPHIDFLATTADAFQQYSVTRTAGNCADCHGDYRAAPYTPNAAARQRIAWAAGLHDSHRNATPNNFLNGNCNACHSGVDRFPVQTGLSTQAAPFNQSCSGCHVGPGLRNHHELMVGVNTCSSLSCHGSEAIGNEKTPLPPVYTASLGTTSTTTRINNPCNDGSAGLVFEGGFFDVLTVGLDNDGDGLYDQDDPDCALAPANNPPVLAPIGALQTAKEGQLKTIAISATDPDNDMLVFTGSNLPPGATLTDNGDGSATFAWTPSFGQAGSYPNVTITVTDNGSPAQSASAQFTITVAPTKKGLPWIPLLLLDNY